jgi:hypothetical protein
LLLEIVYDDLKYDMESVEFKKACDGLRELVQKSSDVSQQEVEIADFLLLQLRFVEMGRAVLEAPSIIQGLEYAAPLAIELLSSYRNRICASNFLREKYIDGAFLLLGAYALPGRDADERYLSPY